MEIRGKEELDRKLRPETIKRPLREQLEKIRLWLQRTLTLSVPVGTRAGGRYRSSITGKVTEDNEVIVGTNLTNPPYPLFVEYGHKQHMGQFVPVLQRRLVAPWVPPSRVTPGTSARQRDIGPFTWTLREAKVKIKDWIKDIQTAIGQRWESWH